jgi:hypothetical protein
MDLSENSLERLLTMTRRYAMIDFRRNVRRFYHSDSDYFNTLCLDSEDKDIFRVHPDKEGLLKNSSKVNCFKPKIPNEQQEEILQKVGWGCFYETLDYIAEDNDSSFTWHYTYIAGLQTQPIKGTDRLIPMIQGDRNINNEHQVLKLYSPHDETMMRADDFVIVNIKDTGFRILGNKESFETKMLTFKQKE